MRRGTADGAIASAWTSEGRSPTCSSSTTRTTGSCGSRRPRRRPTPRRACSPASGASARRPGSRPSELRNIVHGTTVATNAVLECKGARVGLITTQGFGQILHLARSQTPGPLAGWIIMIKPDPPALAGRHARGGRAHGRARQTSSAGRLASRSRAIIGDLVDSGVESLTDQPDQLVRQRRATSRRSPTSSSALYPGFPVDDSARRAARVPRVRAHADGLHELLRAARRWRTYVTGCRAR